MITWNQWLYWAQLKLIKSISPNRDAEILLEKVINKSRVQLLAFGDTKLENNKIIQLKSLISRRKKGEPIAYLTGIKEFWSLNFTVLPGVFVPRPDTECLVEKVLNFLSISHLNVLDLGTGIGTIALALASERPNWNITGLDCQKKALNLANHNKLLFNLENVKFIYGNWFKYLKKNKYNLIISNPPYIDKYDKCLLTDGVNFEPKNALVSKKAGLADLGIICYQSTQHLFTNGWLFLEHGWNQGQDVRKMFYQSGFSHIHTIQDYHHCERITYGQWCY